MDDVRQVTDLEPRRHKINVHDYHQMGEIGLLEERTELVDGEIYDMAPPSSGHAGAVNGLARVLFTACGDRAVVSVQNPVRLDEFNEPQPDFSVLQPQADFYRSRHPGPADVILLVEVSKTSLRFDKSVKLPLYARTGVAEVWVIDLVGQNIEGYRDPVDGAYRTERVFAAGERVALALLPEVSIPLGGLLG